jgi:hypothetical protein
MEDFGVPGVKRGHAAGKAPVTVPDPSGRGVITTAAPKPALTPTEAMLRIPGVSLGHAPGKAPYFDANAVRKLQGEPIRDAGKRCQHCPSGNVHWFGNRERCTNCGNWADTVPENVDDPIAASSEMPSDEADQESPVLETPHGARKRR